MLLGSYNGNLMAIGADLTIDDFERLPDALARNHELVDGQLVDVSGNTPQHNRLRDLLVILLSPPVEEAHLGMVISEQDFDFADNAHGPDVSFISETRKPQIAWNKRVQRFVPDLAIEIVSQNDTYEGLLKKARRYRQCGTAEVWIFSIDLRHAIRINEQGETLLGESASFSPAPIPGFSIRIGDLLNRT
jgi:Uma2 family endonuclease